MRSKSASALEFRVLGPLEARSEGEGLPLGGPKQRALLAVLLLHANEVVSRDRLIDGVWGERPPSTIGAVLNVYLSKLRKLLGTAGSDAALVTQPHGYMLRIEPEQLDLCRFERLVREGREALGAGNPEGAAARLAEALALWRGPPLADLAYMPFAAARIGHLDDLRFCAREDRIEADLALGRHLDLVPELESLVAEYPLRERPRAQLMIALYRTGRQSEALQVYREARRRFAEELGIDPGPELQSLEKAILVQDPALAPPTRPAASLSPAKRRTRRRVAALVRTVAPPGALRRRSLVAALAGLGGVAVPVAVFVLGQGESRRSADADRARTVVARANEVAIVEPEAHKVVARVPVGSNPALIREGDGSVWVADRDDQTVTQIDPESRRVVRTIGIGFRPDDLAAADGAVWAINKEEGVLAKLPYEEISDRFERRGFVGFERIAVDDEAVWLTGGKRLTRVDPATGRIVRRADVPADLSGVAVGTDAVWAVSGPAGAVLRIDPSTVSITDRIPIVAGAKSRSSNPLAVAADTRFVWVLNGSTATVTKIDPELRGIVATLWLGLSGGSFRLAVGEGAVWVSSERDGTVTRIDAETDAMTPITVTPYNSPEDVAIAGGLVWVSVDEG
jgi:DNA-binding SARP family transcriptional activator/DNA-binding beta-propeller fold protein YncE